MPDGYGSKYVAPQLGAILGVCVLLYNPSGLMPVHQDADAGAPLIVASAALNRSESAIHPETHALRLAMPYGTSPPTQG